MRMSRRPNVVTSFETGISNVRWKQKMEDIEPGSISSEEDAGSGSDCEQRIRSKLIQEIWEPSEVWQSLQSLPGAPELIEAYEKRDFDLFLKKEKFFKTAIMVAAWVGEANLIEQIAKKGVSVQISDIDERTALHLAAHCGSSECVKVLIKYGADIKAWDRLHRVTPLHCAASSGNLISVRLLIKAGSDVNAGIKGRSPLHYAAQSQALSCMEELLRAGANPNTPQVFTETPLHVAAAIGSPEAIKLLLEHGAEVKVQYGEDKITALHLAAQDGNAECAQLLLDAGALVNAANNRKQTPLHLAALAQSAETLELFLNRGANPNAADCDGRTPLHSAIVKVSRCCECVRLLLDAKANVNTADSFGYTPLHIAALNEFSNCVHLLIEYGGDVTAKTNGGVSALSFIVRRTPDVLPSYLMKFDNAITLNDLHDIGDVDCELKLDFRVLVPSVNKGETELLLAFIEVGQRHVLKHPLCETFLFLKWKRIRKFFLFSFIYHAFFVLLFTGYIIGVFLRNCPRHRDVVAANCDVPRYVMIMSYFLFILTGLLLIKEIFQLAHSLQNYFKHWENWLQWMIILCVPLCSVPTSNHTNISIEVGNWQHHVAALAIFLTWLELMIIVGRFPMFGLYVQMFQTVAVNFSKFLIAYSCLLIAFGLSFGVLFTNYPPFQNLIWGLIKTVIMMSGELEFEDIFYESNILYPVTAHLMFLAFVLLVTVILTNLMVGLAVSDIQGLQQSAGLDRLVRQAEQVAHLESMLFSKLLWCVPQKILRFCHKKALLLSSQCHYALYIRPNDPRENRVPKELIKNVYRLVVGKKERPKSRRAKQTVKFRDSYRTTKLNEVRDDSKTVEFNYAPAFIRFNSNSSNSEQTSALKAEINQFASDFQQQFSNLQIKLNLLLEQTSSL